ncbi:M23 family metallopeptidase [Micromonospora sp. 4G55]|uniref:M23 family metallopeptidase n=1 Tax=Micromonospora sp. 4G55 TaxID=2806102 RepID=UPI001A56658B|nr:M23 family metallopeptidase [Micromonospora sp. 4G55]MBM0256060.1 M23 family metallopeptidase [Micromonospora sp. 4G55]
MAADIAAERKARQAVVDSDLAAINGTPVNERTATRGNPGVTYRRWYALWQAATIHRSKLSPAQIRAALGKAAADSAGNCVTGTVAMDLDRTQRANAIKIISVGRRLGLPERGLVVAIAVAMQESSLHNLANPVYPTSKQLTTEGVGRDHDSVGLFQQRPSAGWGTVEELMTPEIAAERFYRALKKAPGWQAMSVSEAAQAVQRSAYPNAYAKWKSAARRVVQAMTGSTNCGTGSGWVRPLAGVVTSGFRTAERPQHNGVDLPAARGAAVHAVAAGTILRVVCDARRSDGRPYSCDIDGDRVGVRGCGWFVEIGHRDGSVARYCHLGQRPSVTAGQAVNAGRILGVVGSSGHSSGPHLHLETHTAAPATSGNAVDPVVFLRARGVELTREHR